MDQYLIQQAPCVLPEVAPGLTIVTNAIDHKYQTHLIQEINRLKWIGSETKGGLARRTQHYGYRYDYLQKRVIRPSDVEPLPLWATKLCEFLLEKKWIQLLPNQLIVNEYKNGQGILAHSDSIEFGDTIFSVSLGAPCNMLFKEKKSRSQHTLVISPGTFIKMTGRARYDWTHQIPPLKLDKNNSRISLTFRSVN